MYSCRGEAELIYNPSDLTPNKNNRVLISGTSDQFKKTRLISDVRLSFSTCSEVSDYEVTTTISTATYDNDIDNDIVIVSLHDYQYQSSLDRDSPANTTTNNDAATG